MTGQLEQPYYDHPRASLKNEAPQQQVAAGGSSNNICGPPEMYQLNGIKVLFQFKCTRLFVGVTISACVYFALGTEGSSDRSKTFGEWSVLLLAKVSAWLSGRFPLPLRFRDMLQVLITIIRLCFVWAFTPKSGHTQLSPSPSLVEMGMWFDLDIIFRWIHSLSPSQRTRSEPRCRLS